MWTLVLLILVSGEPSGPVSATIPGFSSAQTCRAAAQALAPARAQTQSSPAGPGRVHAVVGSYCIEVH